MTNDDHAVAAFMAAVDDVVRLAPNDLSKTGAAVLLAIHFGLGTDSRSIAKSLGLAHALILREITAASPRFLTVTKRDGRTQRTWLELTDEGKTIADATAAT